jgi:fructose/tagatose bisphosphate aldolase
MIDGSALPYAENIAITKRVVAWAHAKRISVEAELGSIGGKEDHIDISRDQAAEEGEGAKVVGGEPPPA